MKPREHAANILAAARIAAASRPAAREVKRLVVMGYGAIGDTILFLPVLEGLRRCYPRARLVWVSNPAPVASELIPATGLVDDVWLWEAQVEDPAGREAVNARLRAASFDMAVLTLGTPAHDFLAGLEGVPVVAGHLQPWRGFKRFMTVGDYARRVLVNRPASFAAGEHSLIRNLRLLDVLGVGATEPVPRPHLPVPLAACRRADELLRGLNGPLVVLHLGPTGNQYAKMWAPERFAALSRRLAETWGAALVLVGSRDEEESARRFRAAGGLAASDLVGRTSLLEAFAVLSRCALLISNDTGMAKAAASLGTPTATLWGPSDPAEFGSPWDRDRHLDLRTAIACSPCSWMGMSSRPFNYLNCGHHDCLGRLEVETVAAALMGKWPGLGKS